MFVSIYLWHYSNNELSNLEEYNFYTLIKNFTILIMINIIFKIIIIKPIYLSCMLSLIMP